MRGFVFVFVVGALASGCLRNEFDLCAQTPPDPNCAYLDAQTVGDAGTDANDVDANIVDANILDAGTDANILDANTDANIVDANIVDAATSD